LKIKENINGLYYSSMNFRPAKITARKEKTGRHKTLSLSVDDLGVMIEVIVTPELQKFLTED